MIRRVTEPRRERTVGSWLPPCLRKARNYSGGDWKLLAPSTRPALVEAMRDPKQRRAWIWWVLYDVQGGRCGACGNSYPVFIDHDHETGYVRGLLCRECNVRESLPTVVHISDGCIARDLSAYRFLRDSYNPLGEEVRMATLAELCRCYDSYRANSPAKLLHWRYPHDWQRIDVSVYAFFQLRAMTEDGLRFPIPLARSLYVPTHH
jgi:Recombination endonuclease VII